MKKQDKEKKTDTNHLHIEHSLLSNLYYILKNMIKVEKHFLLLIPLGIVCRPAMQYLWTFISKFVIDMITGEGSIRNLMMLMLVFTVIQIVSTMANTYFWGETWWRYIHTRCVMIREKNYKAMTIDFEYLEDSDVMDCYQKAVNATNNNNEGIEGMMREIVNFLQMLAVVIVGIAILGTMNGYVALLLVVIATLGALNGNRVNKKSKKLVWDPLASWWRKRYYMEYITTDAAAAKDIRMFGLKGWLVEKYKELNVTRLAAQKKNFKLWIVCRIINIILWVIAQVILYGWLIMSVAKGETTIGNFSLYLAASTSFYDYVMWMLESINRLFARSREVDDFRSFVEFGDKAEETQGIDVPKMKSYAFEFRNVSFRYPKAEKDALKNMNLTMKAGERLAVVGLNGAGKSTFIKLLLRLYEPTEGEILLNGINIKKYNKKSYYSIFSPIFQDVELFAFPLAENVSMKAPQDTDRERAREKLDLAGLKDKVDQLKNGVDTEILKVLDDEGVDLSGGEKQKLALARALYKDAPVVVLDEPTAALDALAEKKLYEDFDKLIGGKTAVYISHRLSSTQFCKNVAMFKDGKLEEYGTHTSLMAADGRYAEMFKLQAQYYVENPESRGMEDEGK